MYLEVVAGGRENSLRVLEKELLGLSEDEWQRVPYLL